MISGLFPAVKSSLENEGNLSFSNWQLFFPSTGSGTVSAIAVGDDNKLTNLNLAIDTTVILSCNSRRFRCFKRIILNAIVGP